MRIMPLGMNEPLSRSSSYTPTWAAESERLLLLRGRRFKLRDPCSIRQVMRFAVTRDPGGKSEDPAHRRVLAY